MQPEIFEYQFTVPKSAIDEMHHVNNVVYLQWVQDIAKKHWESKTSEEIRETYVWVVLNHLIKYHHAAFEDDVLTIQTWIDHHRGVKSERHTKIINSTTNKLIVSAKTSWCLLLKETLRPARITDEISTLFG
ncbi:acyl-CoA thioesterase [Aquimarina sp. AD10]|uniref:acyl-CoA thioesterase n=1 Tax=Aquimarina sp. AD10 TaxID=1714849 RepID=UPI000E4D0634|nr:acyl-ACP thioesterase domain-containing protein [Aquimarina sp. AD10]AXT61438.1 acyl-CoA thioesterase [Aquimarina sp. AD10]RKM89923.1 acyl-CoA thioesterase [Aquimarina sp. AD10]